MVDDRLIKNLRREVIHLERNVKFRKIYILKNKLASGITNIGICADYYMPIILSGVLVIGGYSILRSNPSFNEVMEVPKIERMVTSTGYESEKTFAGSTDEDFYVQYSGGWFINDNGLYEREITTFRSNSAEYTDSSSILAMSFEELSNNFKVTNVNKIQKSELDSEDKLYNEDMVIVNRIIENTDNAYIREKNDFEKNVEAGGVLILAIGLGFGLKKVKKKLFKDRTKKWLMRYKDSCKVKSDAELRRLYEMKKQNLELFDDTYTNDRPKIKSRGSR